MQDRRHLGGRAASRARRVYGSCAFPYTLPSGAIPDECGRHHCRTLAIPIVHLHIERHRPGWTRDAAKAELIREARTATFKAHPAGEDAIWETRSGRLLVVRGDGAIATVLPKFAQCPNRRPRR